MQTTHWPDAVDGILDGDAAVMLAYVTPLGGVVLTPMTNCGLRDREAGTVTLTTPLGAWRKLERMQRTPRVALAFHTRAHGFSDRPEYVLVQGEVSFSWHPDREWLESIGPAWDRFMGPRDLGPLWNRWMHSYHWERIGLHIAVDRVVAWPDLACLGSAVVHGAPLPADPPAPQRPPSGGTAPRIDPVRAATRAAGLPDALLGWVGTDGRPMVVPAEVGGSTAAGITLRTGAGAGPPPGGRRAGLTAHRFESRCIGLEQRVHTGWLEVAPGERSAVYAPHTRAGFRLPRSTVAYRAAVGLGTRVGLRDGRRRGLIPAAAL